MEGLSLLRTLSEDEEHLVGAIGTGITDSDDTDELIAGMAVDWSMAANSDEEEAPRGSSRCVRACQPMSVCL
jgi:hypothetical protein